MSGANIFLAGNMKATVALGLRCLRMMMQFFQWRIASLAALTLAIWPLCVAKASANCTYQCESGQIRFTPGQPLTIELVNHTSGLINLERVLGIDLYWLRSQHEFQIQTQVGVDPDMSLVFWDQDDQAVNAVLHRPDPQTLRIEFLPSGFDSDRAVHVANDGWVLVY